MGESLPARELERRLSDRADPGEDRQVWDHAANISTLSDHCHLEPDSSEELSMMRWTIESMSMITDKVAVLGSACGASLGFTAEYPYNYRVDNLSTASA